MQFGQLRINPARNPAILPTATWNPENAWAVIQALDDAYWQSVQQALAQGCPAPAAEHFSPYAASLARRAESMLFLAGLADGQQVFVELGSGGEEPLLGTPLGGRRLQTGLPVTAYPTDAAVIDRFFRFLKPERAPTAMGAVPRLGIGTRMTTAIWPGIFKAMDACGFAANTIQNSVRELNPLDRLLAGRPPDRNYAFNFGMIESGYTGSTYEGLWVSGVLEALKSPLAFRYGADADHIQVKRGGDGLAQAKQLATAARYYTFFTLDMSDILDYAAMTVESAVLSEAYLEARIQDADERKAVVAYHSQPRQIQGQRRRLDRAAIGRLIGKYWNALNAAQELTNHLNQLRQDLPFDLELSIDEHPPEVRTFDCVTTETELMFVLAELRRRQLGVSHIAPNFGVEKGTDYRCPDGLAGLEARIRALLPVAQEFGVMLDFHSGDDLTSATRRVIQRATQGYHHFKISPMLQLLFAEVLADFYPELFRRWWDDALAYARREAATGSGFAAGCLRQYEADRAQRVSPYHPIFHHFSFAFVGRRDSEGQFTVREEFYNLSTAFYHAYQNRVARYLCHLAEELF
jgi:hypothetical protein